VHTHLQGGVVQTAPCEPGRGGQPPTPPTWVPGGPPRVCAWCGTCFQIFLRSPPGYPKTVPIARVNSCRFSIGWWCTRTFRGASSSRRLAHPGGAVSRPHHLSECREGPPACVRGVGRVSKYFFVAPRATPKPSLLPESTLVGFPLDCGAHAPSGGRRPVGALRTREGRSAAHTIFLGAGGAPACVCVVWDAFQEISLWPPGLSQNRPYCQSQLL